MTKQGDVKKSPKIAISTYLYDFSKEIAVVRIFLYTRSEHSRVWFVLCVALPRLHCTALSLSESYYQVISVEMAIEGRRQLVAILFFFLVLHATQDGLRQFRISAWCSNMSEIAVEIVKFCEL